jgi:hypothetical protein
MASHSARNFELHVKSGMQQAPWLTQEILAHSTPLSQSPPAAAQSLCGNLAQLWSGLQHAPKMQTTAHG